MKKIKLSSTATETFFVNKQGGEHEEQWNDEQDIFREADEIEGNKELESEIEAKNE